MGALKRIAIEVFGFLGVEDLQGQHGIQREVELRICGSRANMIKYAIIEIELVDCYPNLSGIQKALG